MKPLYRDRGWLLAVILACVVTGLVAVGVVWAQSFGDVVIVTDCGGGGGGGGVSTVLCFQSVDDCDNYFGGPGCCPVAP